MAWAFIRDHSVTSAAAAQVFRHVHFGRAGCVGLAALVRSKNVQEWRWIGQETPKVPSDRAAKRRGTVRC